MDVATHHISSEEDFDAGEEPRNSSIFLLTCPGMHKLALGTQLTPCPTHRSPNLAQGAAAHIES